MKKLLFLIIFITAVGGLNELSAQPPGPGGGGGDPACFPPPCVPIDGGLSWLLLAGTIYGGKKVFDLNKEKEEII